MPQYTRDQHDEFARVFERDGMVLLPGLLPTDLLLRWRKAFDVLLGKRLKNSATAVRGDNRHYVTLPFSGIFADEAVFCHPDILAIVERVAGEDPVMCQLATDTPMLGSTYQDVHRDTPALFDGFPETPSFQLAVNFPLCDVTLENGPFETTIGTHRIDGADAMRRYNAGEFPLHAVPMRLGDVMIRDVRALHRGTPNSTSSPRPMAVIGYSRSWYFRPEVDVKVPREVFNTLSPKGKRLLRTMPLIDQTAEDAQAESYTKFAY